MSDTPQQPTNQLPLAGHLVIELSTMVTCSLSAMTLRAQGARVIKIEPTMIGDPMRMLGHQKKRHLRLVSQLQSRQCNRCRLI